MLVSGSVNRVVRCGLNFWCVFTCVSCRIFFSNAEDWSCGRICHWPCKHGAFGMQRWLIFCWNCSQICFPEVLICGMSLGVYFGSIWVLQDYESATWQHRFQQGGDRLPGGLRRACARNVHCMIFWLKTRLTLLMFFQVVTAH